MLSASPAAAEKCRAKVDKKTGVIEVSASNVDGASFRWGPSLTEAAYAFFDPGCVKGDKASRCTLADPSSLAAKIPPPACTLYLLDEIAGCTASIPGCVPGVRELDFIYGQIGGDAILDGAIGSSKIAAHAVGTTEIANDAVDSAKLAPAAGRCLVVSTATVLTQDGVNVEDASLQAAREEDGSDSRENLEGPHFPRIPDESYGSVTVSAVWNVTAGEPTRFGCYVFATDDFVGELFTCRTAYFCQ